MADSTCKFYHCNLQSAIRKNLVYLIECGNRIIDTETLELQYEIHFYYVGKEDPVTWVFDDEEIRYKVFGKVLDESC